MKYAKQGRGRVKQALLDFTKAIELNPNAYNYNARGWVYASQGDYKSALTDYAKSIELDPNGDYAYCNRGSVHSKTGNYWQAIADYWSCGRLWGAEELYRQSKQQ